VKGRTLSELFLQTGLLTEDKLKAANSKRVLTGATLFEVVMSEKMIDYLTAAELLSRHYEISSVDLSKAEFDRSAVNLLDYAFCSRYKVIPIKLSGFRLVAAMNDPLNQRILDDIFVRTGCRAEPVFAREEEILYFASQFYSPEHIKTLAASYISDEKFKNDLISSNPDVHTVTATELIDVILEAAVSLFSTDIHFEPFQSEMRVRVRTDGKLRELQTIDISLLSNVIGRLKLMARMDTTERRRPQEGRFTRTINDMDADFKISTIPTIFGEKAVIRVVYGHMPAESKESLGYKDSDLALLDRMFSASSGLVIVTGPAGSGKSTAIASFMRAMSADINITSIEDPVEYILPGVTHISAAGKSGLEFSEALRSALNQDADVIMLGEVPDSQTAKLAVQAAVKGSLVICAMSARDCVSAIRQLIDMGADPSLLAMSIKGVASQRLVRKVCPNCRAGVRIKADHAKLLNLMDDEPVYAAKGCGTCANTGYKGRFLIYELFAADEALRSVIESNGSKADMERCLKGRGFKTLAANAARAVQDGFTTADEAVHAVIL
jgi:type IV pilus assembly protein PilB